MSVKKQKCTKCNKKLNENLFSIRSDTGKPNRRCKNCIAQIKKLDYLENKDIYVERGIASKKKRRKEIREKLNEFKSKPCFDCKETYPYYVMDLDHLKDKKWTASMFMRMCPSNNIIECEFLKCEVVCSNCHRIRTYNRGQYHSCPTKAF